MPEMHVIPNFVKIVRAVLEIYESCVHGQIDRQPNFLQGCDLSGSFSRARNIQNTKFCKNRLSGPRDLRKLCPRTERQTDKPIFDKVETYLGRLLLPET